MNRPTELLPFCYGARCCATIWRRLRGFVRYIMIGCAYSNVALFQHLFFSFDHSFSCCKPPRCLGRRRLRHSRVGHLGSWLRHRQSLRGHLLVGDSADQPIVSRDGSVEHYRDQSLARDQVLLWGLLAKKMPYWGLMAKKIPYSDANFILSVSIFWNFIFWFNQFYLEIT